jgi:hypothetical protein
MLAVASAPTGKSFRAATRPESLSLCVAKEKVTKEKGHPAWRLPGIHARQVRELGPGFSTGLLSGRKGIDIPVDARYAACRPQLAAAQGPPVERRAILARTRCAYCAGDGELTTSVPFAPFAQRQRAIKFYKARP